MEDSYFDANLLDLILHDLLCAAITIFSFGLAIPWVICIAYSFKAKHTVINNHRLIFDGNGVQLFGNFIKWIFLTIITFGIYGFWVKIKMLQWKAKHMHFLN